MSTENFLNYTEVDPNSRIAVVSNRVTWASITRNEITYIYIDKGTAYFSGDFTQYLTIDTTACGNGALAVHWGLANDIATQRAIYLAGGSELYFYVFGLTNNITLTLAEMDSGTGYGDDYTASRSTIEGTVYYLKIVRDESVGTYGTLYCYIYSDDARTTLVDTLSITLHTSKKDFRYLYAFQGYGAAADTAVASGYTKDLQIDSSPVVQTMAPTSITTTTCTGNGFISSIGDASVTQHGHCWNTTGNPTTSDSKTTNGVGAVGAFTSAVTGLISGTRYYIKAYATNSYGTGYGDGYSFIADVGFSVMRGGNIAIVETRLHYIGNDGKEYYLQGTAV